MNEQVTMILGATPLSYIVSPPELQKILPVRAG